MQARLTPTHLEVLLTPLEKAGGLRGNLRIPRESVVEARVDPDPIATIGWRRLMVGLRIPKRLFVAHSERFQHFWAVKRGLPGVHVRVRDGRPREVTVSAPDAERIVAELNARA